MSNYRNVRAVVGAGLLVAAGFLSGCGSTPAPPLLSAAGGAAGASASGCQRTADCPAAQVCSPDGRCVGCYSDRDCKADEHCAQETCIQTVACSSAADCASDQMCTAGQCEPLPSAGGAGGGGAGGSGGAGQATAGSSTGGSNTGGTSTGGSSTGGSAAAGTSGNGAGGASSCPGVQVLFVIQRSGSMFELPDTTNNYWSMVEDALVGTDNVTGAFQGKLELGALFFLRETTPPGSTCPELSPVAAKLNVQADLSAAFDSNAAAAATLVTKDVKVDAPVPEAERAAATLLASAAHGHIVLITTGVPDTCTLTDTACDVDPTLKAVQDAWASGVTTHVIGLGDSNGQLDSLALASSGGTAIYLQQLANAGAGQPAQAASDLMNQCTGLVAKYSATSGSTPYYLAKSATDVQTAVQTILTEVCP